MRYARFRVLTLSILLGLAVAPIGRAAAIPTVLARDDEAQARFDVQRLLDAMAAAAIAGDEEAYLALVDTADREFLNEQKYFAKDLKRATPELVRMALEEKGFELGDGEARGTVTLRWNMPGAKERTVEAPTRFVRGAEGWRYAGEVWRRVEKPAGAGTVVVLFDDGLATAAENTATAFARVREGVEAGFDLTGSELSRRAQKIKLYGSMRHLQASICLAYDDSLAGWNEPGESIKLLVRPTSSVASLTRLLAHEYGHVATFELGEKANSMPWWMLEGIAEFSAADFKGEGGTRRLVRLAAEEKLAPWEELADFHTVPDRFRGHVYFQGHHMVAFVDREFGREARIGWLRGLAEGKSLDEATKAALGSTFEQLDGRWREGLKAREGEEKEEKGKGE